MARSIPFIEINDGFAMQVCYDEEPIPYSSSQKIGDSVQWTADKNPIHLN